MYILDLYKIHCIFPQGACKTLFVDGIGGTSKTFVYNLVLAYVRQNTGENCAGIALGVASSGIAALLLEGGRTAHSRFKIAIPIFDNSTCG